MTNEEKELHELNKVLLSNVQNARELYHVDNGRSLSMLLRMVEDQEAAKLEEDADKEKPLNPTLKRAFQNAPQARGKENC